MTQNTDRLMVLMRRLGHSYNSYQLSLEDSGLSLLRGLELAFVLLSCINFPVDVQVIASRIGSSRFSKLL